MDQAENWPYVTGEVAGIGGRIKDRPEDFCVVEVPLYEPCGQGTHVYFGLQKRGLSTPAAIERVARMLRVPVRRFGAAGLKDAQAVSEQSISVEHLTDPQVQALQVLAEEKLRVTWVSRHTNKLKPGHLAGNRFVIRIRQVEPDRLEACRQMLTVLARRGVPNYFGRQRFGRRGDNARLGRALVVGDVEGFTRVLLGEPRAGDPPDCRRARELFEGGQLAEAQKAWPRQYRNERVALAALLHARPGHPCPHRGVLSALDTFTKRLMVSAYQSLLFNRVLARRIDGIDTVQIGDWARKTDTGGVFLVEDEAVEAPRARAFEISPTGPLYGYRVSLAQGAPGRIEQEVLEEEKLSVEQWRRSGAHKVKGMRRALRFPLYDASAEAGGDEHGPFIEVRFAAPAGCFATVALREIMKAEVVEES